MKAQYLFRLDDACPWHQRSNWQRLENLFDKFSINPLVAIIPACEDPDFTKYPLDPEFWTRALIWQNKGWSLGLHGYDHKFLTKKSGLVPLNNYSEFAGVSRDMQREKIHKGWTVLTSLGLSITWWVAPAHSFDSTTLKVLAQETTIRNISDGLYTKPFFRQGFLWVPQQLWKPRSLRSGIWTLCLHPNEMTEGEFTRLEAFLEKERLNMGNWDEIATATHRRDHPSYGPLHWLYQTLFLAAKKVKSFLRK